MAKWNYFMHSCEVCKTEKDIRADVHYRLEREGRSWVCRSCSSTSNGLKNSYKHGYYNSPTYISWRKMKDRCLNKNHKYFYLYGGRGITICPEWMEFKGFLQDMGEMPEKGFSIDRIDNDKGYYKDNCRWIPRNEQQKNRRVCKKAA